MIDIRESSGTDIASIKALYSHVGYAPAIGDADRLVLATDGERIVGAVRLCRENDVAVLRGMQILPEYQRASVGTKMLERFVDVLGDTDCYCVPYSYLEGFYGKAGFLTVDPAAAPEFLADRLTRYRADGKDVILMFRRNAL